MTKGKKKYYSLEVFIDVEHEGYMTHLMTEHIKGFKIPKGKDVIDFKIVEIKPHYPK